MTAEIGLFAFWMSIRGNKRLIAQHWHNAMVIALYNFGMSWMAIVAMSVPSASLLMAPH